MRDLLVLDQALAARMKVLSPLVGLQFVKHYSLLYFHWLSRLFKVLVGPEQAAALLPESLEAKQALQQILPNQVGRVVVIGRVAAP